jgi:hypothetical protein
MRDIPDGCPRFVDLAKSRSADGPQLAFIVGSFPPAEPGGCCKCNQFFRDTATPCISTLCLASFSGTTDFLTSGSGPGAACEEGWTMPSATGRWPWAEPLAGRPGNLCCQSGRYRFCLHLPAGSNFSAQSNCDEAGESFRANLSRRKGLRD